jgi:uncharacterized protein (DUF58 family)
LRVDRELVARLSGARLSLPGLTVGQQAGDRRSPFRGRGMEFADHRPYRPGDDLRLVDWSAYRRLRTVLVRLFHEDRTLHAGLCVDCSASMGAGAPRKADHAGTLAACLALVALQHRDLVTMALAGATGDRVRVRGHQAAAFASFLSAIEGAEPAGVPDLVRALRGMTDRGRPDRLVLLSDLLLEDAAREEVLRALAASGLRPLVLHVLDRSEVDPDLSRGLEAVDVETGEVVQVGDDPASARAYREAVAEFLKSVRSRCAALGVQYVPAFTSVPVREIVLDSFRAGRLVESARGGRA